MNKVSVLSPLKVAGYPSLPLFGAKPIEDQLKNQSLIRDKKPALMRFCDIENIPLYSITRVYIVHQWKLVSSVWCNSTSKSNEIDVCCFLFTNICLVEVKIADQYWRRICTWDANISWSSLRKKLLFLKAILHLMVVGHQHFLIIILKWTCMYLYFCKCFHGEISLQTVNTVDRETHKIANFIAYTIKWYFKNLEDSTFQITK